jgi:ABC-type multidrug transport system permease subunit
MSFIGTSLTTYPGIFIRESSSRIYSPFVFAIGQLLGEIPYSIVCGIIYWVLMVRFALGMIV